MNAPLRVPTNTRTPLISLSLFGVRRLAAALRRNLNRPIQIAIDLTQYPIVYPTIGENSSTFPYSSIFARRRTYHSPKAVCHITCYTQVKDVTIFYAQKDPGLDAPL